MNAHSCRRPGCTRIADPGPLCQHHLMKWRRGMGLCANCGGSRVQVPTINALTGRQLRRGPQRLPVYEMRCSGCGRVQRARAVPA
jgi:hypothetical protein